MSAPDVAIEPAPEWFLDLCRKAQGNRRRAETREPLIELDTPHAIGRATQYLLHSAPEAVEGAGGDHATYQVAARVREFGISEDACLDLMAEHWNEHKASPPWGMDELALKVENAYRYADGAWGGASAAAEFEPVEIGQTEGHSQPAKPLFGAEWITAFDPADLPKREWVLGRFLAKGYLAGLVAPPGAGKTTLELMMAVALAAGRPDILGWDFCVRQRVFVWNQEDEAVELKRRLAAVMIAFGVSWDDLAIDGRPALLIGSGIDAPLLIAKRAASGRLAPSKEHAQLIELLRSEEIGVAMFDPFVELHQGEENDNVEIAAVGQAFRAIAVKAHCAVLLSHHTRKPPSGESAGHAGNMDSARGAGSLVGVTRMGATLYTIDEKTAAAHGVPEDERHLYVRLDDGKGNMSLVSGKPSFFRRETVNIRTFEDPEDVGVLRPALLARKTSKAERDKVEVLDALRALMEEHERLPLLDAARRLVASDPLFDGIEAGSLKKRIARAFQDQTPTDMVLQDMKWAGRNKPMQTVVRILSDNRTEEVGDGCPIEKDE